MNVFETDCRSEDGITVGLIDSIITLARVLSTRDKNTETVYESLKDLRQDEDVAELLACSGLEIYQCVKHRNDLADKIISQQTEINALKARLRDLGAPL